MLESRKKEKKAPSKRVLAGVVRQPAVGRQRASPGVGAALLVHCGIWVADRRCQEPTVAVWGAVAESAVRRAQKTQKKAVKSKDPNLRPRCSQHKGSKHYPNRVFLPKSQHSFDSQGACME